MHVTVQWMDVLVVNLDLCLFVSLVIFRETSKISQEDVHANLDLSKEIILVLVVFKLILAVLHVNFIQMVLIIVNLVIKVLNLI